MSGIVLFYPKLVKEFIVNLSKGFNNGDISEFSKVYLHGPYFEFSLAIINEYLGRGRLITYDHISSMKTISQESTENVHDNWSAKGLFSASSMSVKYVILNKIGVSNLAPTKHGPSITPYASLLYQIGT